MKKKFLDPTSGSLLVIVFRSIFAGIFYALASFFTKESLEKWKSKKETNINS